MELNESQPNRGQGTRLVDAKHVEGREARDFFAWKNCGNFGGKKSLVDSLQNEIRNHTEPRSKKVEPQKWWLEDETFFWNILYSLDTLVFWGCISTWFRCYSDMSTCHFVALVPESSRSARIFTQWSPLRNGSWLVSRWFPVPTRSFDIILFHLQTPEIGRFDHLFFGQNSLRS